MALQHLKDTGKRFTTTNMVGMWMKTTTSLRMKKSNIGSLSMQDAMKTASKSQRLRELNMWRSDKTWRGLVS